MDSLDIVDSPTPTPDRPATPARNADAVWWTALVADTNCAVYICDADGVIKFSNEAAAAAFNCPLDRVVGKSLSDFIDPEMAQERTTFIRQVASTKKPITLDQMVNGVYLRSSIRPLPSEPNAKERVLVVSRSTHPGEVIPPGGGELIVSKANDPGRLSALTTREMEILKLIGEGLSTAEIAKRLHRSVKTIEWHRVSLGNKLGITNRVELAHIAIRAGLVAVEAQGVTRADAATTPATAPAPAATPSTSGA